MFSNLDQAALACANTLISQSGNFVNGTLRRILTTAQHTLTFFGLGSLILLCLIFLKPESLNRLQAGFARISQTTQTSQANTPSGNPDTLATASISNGTTTIGTDRQTQSASANTDTPHPSSVASTANMPGQAIGQSNQAFPAPYNRAKPASKPSGESIRQQRLVSDWLSKRYRVAKEATVSLVTMSYQTAHEIEFDPLLILAVMAIESGLNPIAESPMGAQGLMQVMSKVHYDKFQSLGGLKEALNPVANIKVGALILKDYVARGGSLQAGLKTYVGAGAFDTAAGYGSRVIAEYQRLKQVADGKPVPFNIAPPTTIASPLPLPVNSKKPLPTEVAEDKDNMAVL